MSDNSIYPPTGFQFRVQFEGIGPLAAIDSYFQEVSGLNASVETESYQQIDKRYAQFLPTKVSYETLKLKRGFTTSSELTSWVTNAIDNFDFLPATVHIQLMNAEGKPLYRWSVSDAIPVKRSITSFNAESSSLVIESLELKYEFFRENT